MVKIKDFTLASKNLGGGHVPPCPTHLPPMAQRPYYLLSILALVTIRYRFWLVSY